MKGQLEKLGQGNYKIVELYDCLENNSREYYLKISKVLNS